jgi:hypothetical protein
MQGEALPGITAPDYPKRTAEELKELLRAAWSNLANRRLTPIERREARRQAKQYSAELRRYLQRIAAENSGPRWLGISDLIAEPEGPTFISSKVARSRLYRLRS